MYNPAEYPQGVPNPYTPGYHPYPSFQHGADYTRPVFEMPYVRQPFNVLAGVGQTEPSGPGFMHLVQAEAQAGLGLVGLSGLGAGPLDNPLMAQHRYRLAECGVSAEQYTAEALRLGISESDEHVPRAIDLVEEMCPTANGSALRAGFSRMLLYTAVASVVLLGVGIYVARKT